MLMITFGHLLALTASLGRLLTDTKRPTQDYVLNLSGLAPTPLAMLWYRERHTLPLSHWTLYKSWVQSQRHNVSLRHAASAQHWSACYPTPGNSSQGVTILTLQHTPPPALRVHMSLPWQTDHLHRKSPGFECLYGMETSKVRSKSIGVGC